MQDTSDSSRQRNGRSLIISCVTVFVSSFCIMVLELVASRLIARHLGSSLYTWTAVIGVVLAGITIGNYLGGRIADKFPARRAIAILFAICSVVCVVTVILNNIVGEWTWLWYFNWPLRVFSHVSLVFLLPSVLLGTISPVVAKMALDRGLPTGRTVGDIYAWGAAGSIAGTFAAGYWLIATMGTIAIIWTIGAVLLLMSILYWARLWVLYIWAIIFIALMTMAMIPAEWAKSTALSIALRERPDPSVLYEDESRYFHIAVKQPDNDPNRRSFNQDKLQHSEILMHDILDLQYFYTKIYAAVTEVLGRNKEKLCVMAIGGGGYVFPRYVEKVWPGSRIDVAEIDPDVTRAATLAFGLEKNTTINTINMDARNYVDKLLEQKHSGGEIPQYDFIYGDAFNDFSVPFQLVTREFNEKISAILSDDGVYMINLIDIFDSGLFLGSAINTLEKTFPYVYVVVENIPRSDRDTFVIIAARHKLDLKNIISQYKREELKIWYLDDSDISKLRGKSRQLVLTDDYSPVENLLAPVVRRDRDESIVYAHQYPAREIAEEAQNFAWKGDLENTIRRLDKLVELDPAVSARAYYMIARIFTDTQKYDSAVQIYERAFEKVKDERFGSELADLHRNYAILLRKLNRNEEAMKHYSSAQEYAEGVIKKEPQSAAAYTQLGNVFAGQGNLEKAIECFQKAVDLKPVDLENQMNLIHALHTSGQIESAIEKTQAGIDLMVKYWKSKEADELRDYLKYLESLEYKNSKSR